MSKNLLYKETSPYLLQHQNNPVHWHPWGDAAFKKAEKEDKPILLSIGYAACHWCHVMAHESFEDKKTAEMMNEKFINIKLDREERPDLDHIYQTALSLLGQQGGWPLTIFMDSTKRPFWGGTYFPNKPRHGMPAFQDVLEAISKSFNNQRSDINKNKNIIFDSMQKIQQQKYSNQIDDSFYDKVTESYIENSDPINGGFKGAPKFPQFFIYEFLLKEFTKSKNQDYLNITIKTLDQICSGGIYDHIGGGLSRYTVDDKWLVPHFEKMLYDNAQFISILNNLWLITKNNSYKTKIYETVDWLKRDMQDKYGAFYSSFDADSEGVEGKFYVWTYSELERILKDDFDFFAKYFEIKKDGNWESKIILSRYDKLHISDDDSEKIKKLVILLFNNREKRVKPACDYKILCDWNSLLIDSLAKSSVLFQEKSFLDVAVNSFDFIQSKMIVNGILFHSHCSGVNKHSAMLEDYAYIIKASLTLFEVTNDKKYLDFSLKTAKNVMSYFSDDNGMFFTSSTNQDDIIINNKPITDNVMPNANAVMIENLTRLFTITSNLNFINEAEKNIKEYSSRINNELLGICSFLNSLDFYNNTKTIIIAGKDNKKNRKLFNYVNQEYLPNIVILTIDNINQLTTEFEFYKNIKIGDDTLAYICQNNTCSLPISDRNDIIKVLKDD